VDGSVLGLGPSPKGSSRVKQNLFDIVTQLIETAWRRRVLIALPILVMLPLSIIGSRFLPQTYITKALLVMSETGSDNPLIKAPGTNERIRDRAPGLQALVKSDRVLMNALHDILGERMPSDPKRIAQALKDLDGQLTFEMIGTDFLELQLKGSSPVGLGRKLDAITSRFLESLVSPDQAALSATQVLLDKRREDLASAEKALARFKEQLGERALAAIAANDARLKEAQAALQTQTADLAAVDAEISALKSTIGAFASAENAGKRQAEINLAVTTAEAAEKGRTPASQAEALAARGRAAQLTQLQALETRGATLRRDLSQATSLVADQTRVAADSRSPEGQLRRLERDVAEARALFDSYRQRFPAAVVGRSLQVLNAPERIRVIDAPRDPQFPATSRLKFMLAGLMAGLVLAAGLTGCAELLDQRLRRAPDFEAIAGVPVIGRLPPALPEPESDTTIAKAPEPASSSDGYGANVTPFSKSRQSSAA
jgi:uncharacterized protein involved in exopolysaccharide biosynthesis